jgi:hypothetical protein
MQMLQSPSSVQPRQHLLEKPPGLAPVAQHGKRHAGLTRVKNKNKNAQGQDGGRARKRSQARDRQQGKKECIPRPGIEPGAAR